ncbi:MAG: bifunctional adenosylcobinamide kinase/adenosylcobinamide-phosphate guanylyltransferase [Clostridiales bacterium]|nr:bifunctional adenosylcobinamide kinase/adenosylcobinamide-phosphate guanylyltransferase [Clostridiales bacterium]
MIFIFGGAYQGKLAYARDRFGLADSDIYRCGESAEMPEGGKVICGLEKWILALVYANADVEDEMQRFIRRNEEAVVICDDISGGVVPADATLRKWREAAGKAATELASHSDEVIRLFCGIPTRIK